MRERIARIAPGLAMLASYRRQDLPHDLVAGLSVAAVALPVGVAYAELAGDPPADLRSTEAPGGTTVYIDPDGFTFSVGASA